ncbi:O-methyltransferase [Halarchaeum salinum]
MSLLPEDVQAVTAATVRPSPLLEEMATYGREQRFPIVGPETGQFLQTLATLVNARRVFEFGSGFGYSAAWFIDALPANGEIVLTDYDATNLERAEAFLSRSDYRGEVHYESGDAMESFDRYDGPWDAVLIDHDKSQYMDALELARPRLAEGAVVVADNILRGPMSPADVRAALEGANDDLSERLY